MIADNKDLASSLFEINQGKKSNNGKRINSKTNAMENQGITFQEEEKEESSERQQLIEVEN